MDNSSQIIPESNISSASNSNSLFGQVYNLDNNSPDSNQLFNSNNNNNDNNNNNSMTNSLNMGSSINQTSSTSIFDQPNTQPSDHDQSRKNSVFSQTQQQPQPPTTSLFDSFNQNNNNSENTSPKSLFDGTGFDTANSNNSNGSNSAVFQNRTTSNTTTNSETSSFMQMNRPLPTSEKLSRETSPPTDQPIQHTGHNFDNFQNPPGFQNLNFQKQPSSSSVSSTFQPSTNLPKPSWDANVKIPSSTPWGDPSSSSKSPETSSNSNNFSSFGVNFKQKPPEPKNEEKNHHLHEAAPKQPAQQPVIIKRIENTQSNIYALLNSRKNKDGKNNSNNFSSSSSHNNTNNNSFSSNFQKQNSSGEYNQNSSSNSGFNRQSSSEYNPTSRLGPKDYGSKFNEAKDYGSKFSDSKDKNYASGSTDDKKGPKGDRSGSSGGKFEEAPKFSKSEEDKFVHEINPKYVRPGMKCYTYKDLLEIAKRPRCQRVPKSQNDKIDFANKKYLCPRSEKWDPRLFLHAERQRRFPELFEKERIEKEQVASSRHLAEAIKNAQSDVTKDDKKLDMINSDDKEQDQVIPERKEITNTENKSLGNQVAPQESNDADRIKNSPASNSGGKNTPTESKTVSSNNNYNLSHQGSQNSGVPGSPSSRPRVSSGTLHRQPKGPGYKDSGAGMDNQALILKLCKERMERAKTKGTEPSIGFDNVRTTTEPETNRNQASPSPKSNLPPTIGRMRADNQLETSETQLHGTARQTRSSGNNNNNNANSERRGFDFGNKADSARGNACFDDWKSARDRKWKETIDVNDEQVAMEIDGAVKDPAFRDQERINQIQQQQQQQQQQMQQNQQQQQQAHHHQSVPSGNFNMQKQGGFKSDFKKDYNNQGYKNNNPSQNSYQQYNNNSNFEPSKPVEEKFDLFEEIKRRKQNAAAKERAKAGNIDGQATLKSGVTTIRPENSKQQQQSSSSNNNQQSMQTNDKPENNNSSSNNKSNSKQLITDKNINEIKEFKPQKQVNSKKSVNKSGGKNTAEIPEWMDDDIETGLDPYNIPLKGFDDDIRNDPAIQNTTRKLLHNKDTENKGKDASSSKGAEIKGTWLDAKMKLPQQESEMLGEVFKKHLDNTKKHNVKIENKNEKMEKIWGNVQFSNNNPTSGWGENTGSSSITQQKNNNKNDDTISNLSQDKMRHLDEINRITEKLKQKSMKNKQISGNNNNNNDIGNNVAMEINKEIPAALEDWGKVPASGDFNRDTIWSNNTENSGNSRNKSNDNYDAMLKRLNEPTKKTQAHRDYDGYTDGFRNGPFESNNNQRFGRVGGGDDYRSGGMYEHENFNQHNNNNSGQQVGYRMRDLQTGQVTLFNPKADDQEQIFVPESRMHSGRGTGGRSSMMNAPSQRQNWPPNEQRMNGHREQQPWTNNPMYGDAYENRESFYPRGEYDSRGEFYPQRNPYQHAYQEYDMRGQEHFYEPRDRRHHQNQHYQEAMFQSGEWNPQMEHDYYWSQKDQQQW